MRLRLERRTSPIFQLLLVTDENGALRVLDFAGHESRMTRLLQLHYDTCTLDEGAAPAAVIRALDAYFDGDLDALAAVPVATGGTAFQRQVWSALRAIPSGTTTSYGELAASIGRAGASRAVGAANGANPIAIVVPCHRVIGASGALTGFASGLGRKRWLLDHEHHFAKPGTVPSGRSHSRCQPPAPPGDRRGNSLLSREFLHLIPGQSPGLTVKSENAIAPAGPSLASAPASTAAAAGLQSAFLAKEDAHALFADLQGRPRHRGRAHARALAAD